MITIENMEIHLEVEEGDSEEARFAQLFEKFIRRWSERETARHAELDREERDRRLGGHEP